MKIVAVFLILYSANLFHESFSVENGRAFFIIFSSPILLGSIFLFFFFFQLGKGHNFNNDVKLEVNKKIEQSWNFSFSLEAQNINTESKFFKKSFDCTDEQFRKLQNFKATDKPINWKRGAKSGSGNQQDLFSFLSYALRGELYSLGKNGTKLEQKKIKKYFEYLSENITVKNKKLDPKKMAANFDNWINSTEISRKERIEEMKLEMKS